MVERFISKGVKALRWSEKYTKTDMLYLTKGGFWLALGQGIIALSGLIMAVAFANLIPKESYGTYQFIMSMGVIISAFTLTGMGTSIMREVAQGSEGALRAGFRTQLIWSIGMVFVAGAFSFYYFLNENNTLAISFLIVGAFSPFLQGFGLTRSYFIGKQLFRESALLGLWRRFIPVITIVTTIWLTHNPVIIVFAYFASNTFSAGLLYWLVINKYNHRQTEEVEMINYSKHLSLLRLFSEVTSQADKVLIWNTLGAAPVAAYTLALLPIKHMKSAIGLLNSLSFPKLSTIEFSILKKTLPRKVRVLLLLVVVTVAVYIIIAPFLFKILFPAYPESILLTQILALTVLSKPRSLYSQALIAHKKKQEQYINTISMNVLRLALLLILLPMYGLWGAVYAVLVTHLCSNILVRYLFHRAKI